MNVIETVKKLESLFIKRGFSLFFVGGSVRDYLLYKEFFDDSENELQSSPFWDICNELGVDEVYVSDGVWFSKTRGYYSE